MCEPYILSSHLFSCVIGFQTYFVITHKKYNLWPDLISSLPTFLSSLSVSFTHSRITNKNFTQCLPSLYVLCFGVFRLCYSILFNCFNDAYHHELVLVWITLILVNFSKKALSWTLYQFSNLCIKREKKVVPWSKTNELPEYQLFGVCRARRGWRTMI